MDFFFSGEEHSSEANSGPLASVILLETPETPIVRPKGENAMEQYREAEHPGPQDAGADPGQAAPGIPLRTRLEAPEHYESQVRDATGKLNVYTDAEVEIPEVEEVPAIYVRRHDSGQEDIDVVTRALFGDADVYDARGYMQKTKEEWQIGRAHV